MHAAGMKGLPHHGLSVGDYDPGPSLRSKRGNQTPTKLTERIAAYRPRPWRKWRDLPEKALNLPPGG